MDRRSLLKQLSILGLMGGLTPSVFSKNMLEAFDELKKSDFGPDFVWGAATAAYQIEGAYQSDGKGLSIWDTFTHRKGTIKDHSNGDTACDFYNRYAGDLGIVKQLNLRAFRFSTSWSRVLPQGTGSINQKGLDFYKKLVDTCLEKNIQPWLTLYHWDLPQALEDKGGWPNRDVTGWFMEYVELMARTLGDRVKNWMVFNEPMAFTGLGYMAGIHAPGKKSLEGFKKAVHHVVLSQAEAGRRLRGLVSNANIGTTFSVSSIHPKSDAPKHVKAARRMDALFNRLFIEPALGLGYPVDGFSYLKSIEKYMQAGDAEKMAFDFDFVGIQNYFRIVATHSLFPPVMWANQVKPKKLTAEENLTDMGWEVYPAGIYEVIKKFGAYKNIPPIYITENGTAFHDTPVNGEVHDPKRIQYFKDYLKEVLRAKKEGITVNGYFVWSLMDNFEWAEGYKPRFGLVYTDYDTQERIIKDSGKWFQAFLK